MQHNRERGEMFMEMMSAQMSMVAKMTETLTQANKASTTRHLRDAFYCNDETYEAQPKAEQLNLGEAGAGGTSPPPFHRQYTRLTSSSLFAMQDYGYSQYHQRSGELSKLYYKSLDHGTNSGGFNGPHAGPAPGPTPQQGDFDYEPISTQANTTRCRPRSIDTTGEKKRMFKLNEGTNHHKTLQDEAGRSSSPSCDLESECGARLKAGGSPRTKMAVADLSEKIMADASMYTDDTAAGSSSTVGGSSSDDDERSNQQELTARGRSESQGQISDQDTDLDRSSYFVLSDPNYIYEAVSVRIKKARTTAINSFTTFLAANREEVGDEKKAPPCSKQDLEAMVSLLYSTAATESEYLHAAHVVMMWYLYGRSSGAETVEKSQLSILPAMHANDGTLSENWIIERGGWQLDRVNMAFGYMLGTTQADQKVSRVLSGWKPKDGARLPTLAALDTPILARARKLQQLLFSSTMVFADAALNLDDDVTDVLTATLFMHYPDISPITKIRELLAERVIGESELLAWSVTISKAFVTPSASEAFVSAGEGPSPALIDLIKRQSEQIDVLILQNKRLDERIFAVEAHLKTLTSTAATQPANADATLPASEQPPPWFTAEPRVYASRSVKKTALYEYRHIAGYLMLFLPEGFALDISSPAYKSEVLELGDKAQQNALTFLKSHGSSAVAAVCVVAAAVAPTYPAASRHRVLGQSAGRHATITRSAPAAAGSGGHRPAQGHAAVRVAAAAELLLVLRAPRAITPPEARLQYELMSPPAPVTLFAADARLGGRHPTRGQITLLLLLVSARECHHPARDPPHSASSPPPRLAAAFVFVFVAVMATTLLQLPTGAIAQPETNPHFASPQLLFCSW
ncbi:hypothetical protein PHYSODRAFT_324362 [Phytophthora sojae]|uniref:Uncharacterized protein n=1 Tax=Phytophthora sojae (strain P6497) TaxID=1094619 RepID=G4YU30_PHYSP|nr:hypothetical protein PHYSODRAFT_324362 [Phytophthora sojae]EGZ23108.1 hypothetical protein PHYSODRAFT_324362 [Phytophthora sojae]|eukprot:XP_009518396.1 hypothetical protein PHYSODRAFT_324362 [Phytophthora sojae]